MREAQQFNRPIVRTHSTPWETAIIFASPSVAKALPLT